MPKAARYLLAQATQLLQSDRPTDEILHELADLARELIPSHQAALSLTAEENNWSQVISAISLSDKYAEYRDFDAAPTGGGIMAWACNRGLTVRMTQAELLAHPAWENFGAYPDEHPPMVGWLAAPLTAVDGHNMGLLQLSDRIEGEFTEEDELFLLSLARIGAIAIERAVITERLRQTEQQLATALHSASEGLVVISPDGVIEMANAAVVEIFGRKPGTVADLAEQLQNTGSFEGQQASAAMKSGAAYRASLPLGQDRRLFVAIPAAEEGRPRVVTLTDVSSLEAERERHEMLDDVVRQSPDGLVVVQPIMDASGGVEDFASLLTNDAMQRVRNRRVMPGERLHEIFSQVASDKMLQLCNEVLTTRQPRHTEIQVSQHGDSELCFEVTVSPVHQGVSVSCKAVTEQKQMERELRKNSELLERSQQAAHIGSWEWNPASNQLTWSDEVYRIFGYQPGEIEVTREWVDAQTHPDDYERATAVASAGVAAGELAEIEYRIVRPDGSARNVQIDGNVVVDADGETRVMGTMKDVTERREMDDNLNRAQRLQSLGVMAAGIAHDFNNILGVVTINAGMLERHLRQLGVTGYQEHLESLTMATKRASDLTRRLLTFTGQQSRNVERIDLDEAIREMMPMLQSAVGERFSINYTSTAQPVVLADRTQTEQVVLNLVLNARDAIAEAGIITMKLSEPGSSNGFDSRWGRSPSGTGAWSLLEITDTGMGMDTATMQRIYDPFFTTKTGGRGTGLGIPVVFSIVQQTGGHMEITSAPGKGTAVSIVLPMEDRRSQAPEGEESPGDASPLGQERVLLVEDDDQMREMTAEALRDLGYQVTAVAAPAGARQSATRGAFDVLVCDILLPDEDGVSLSSAFLRAYPHMVVVLTSGTSPPDTLPHPQRSTFVAKPYSGVGLASAIRRLLTVVAEPAGRFGPTSRGGR